MIAYLVIGISFGFACAVQPGTYQIFVISLALSNGWRNTLLAALAPLLSDGPILVLVMVILSNLPGWIEPILHLAGGVFVIYLAVNSFLSFKKYNFNPVMLKQPAHKNLLKAAFINLLNPNPYLMWSLVLGPLLLRGWHESPSHGIAMLIGFYCTIVLGVAFLIVLFSTLRQLGPRITRIFLALAVLALAGFGLYQLYLGITGLV